MDIQNNSDNYIELAKEYQALKTNYDKFEKRYRQLFNDYNQLLTLFGKEKIVNLCNETLLNIYDIIESESVSIEDIDNSLSVITQNLNASFAVIFDEYGNVVNKSDYKISKTEFKSKFERFVFDFTKAKNNNMSTLFESNEAIYKIPNENDEWYSFYKENNIHNLLAIPIKNNKEKKIMLIINTPYSSKLVGSFAQRIAKQYASLYNRINYQNQIMDAANHDELTGLLSSNSYHRELEYSAEYDSHNISVIIGDLFRLKYVNDNLGHTYGDLYINYVATILKNTFEEDDIKYRIGGDEFLIICIEKDKHYIEEKIEEVNDLIKMNPIMGPDGESIDAEISFGYSLQSNPKKSLKELVAEADDMLKINKTKLYQEKGIDRRK